MEAGLRRNWLHLKWCSQFQCRRPSHLCNSYAFPDTADFVIYTHYCISWESSAWLTLVTILSTPVWYRCAWKGIMAWLTLVKGLRPVLEGFVVTMHEGACETGSQIPRALARGLDVLFAQTECIVTTNPDRSVLITIITWHFQFRPVNVSILHLKDDYRARSESRFACYAHCYVTWCPLTTGIVASQCPSARDAVLVMRYLTPFTSACLNSFLRFLPQ